MAQKHVHALLALALFAPIARAASPSTGTAPAPDVEVPFGCGYAFPVSQTHNIGSHLQNDIWAWDFRMPEGTPVTAARAGVVRMARGDSSEGGCDPRFAPLANYVVVDHGDGLETQYLHFSNVVVKAGDKVKAGDLLGYSGKTGWACGAHLHFKVARHVLDGWNNPSVPAKFVGYGDPALESTVSAPSCDAQHVYIAARPPMVTPQQAVKAALASASGASAGAGAQPETASGRAGLPSSVGATRPLDRSVVPSVAKQASRVQAVTEPHREELGPLE